MVLVLIMHLWSDAAGNGNFTVALAENFRFASRRKALSNDSKCLC